MLPLDDVKDWLKITVDTHDAQIQELIDRATAIIERESQWYFGPARAAEEVLDGTGTRALFLRQPPVNGVTVFTRSGATDTWEEVPSADYEQDDRGLYVAGRWARGSRNFRATYSEGFAEVPGDIAQLLLDLVKYKWDGRVRQGDLKSERIGDYAYTRADLEEMSSWVDVQRNWRRLRI